MASLSDIKEAMQNEELVIQRGLVLIAGLLAGAGLAFALLSGLPKTVLESDGVVGLLSLGMASPWERLSAIGILVGGMAGAILGQWAWMGLGWLQRLLGHLPPAIALRRAAVPFSVFLTYITYLCQGTPMLIWPVLAFLGLAVGFLLLAFLGQRDKRKIYFANPTDSEYSPIAVFTHGSVIVLGAGAGWYLESLPNGLLPSGLAGAGLWLAVMLGIAIWMGSLLLAAALNLVFSKQTYDQVYLAVAVALLPLAFLPLQTIGVLTYLEQGKTVAGRNLDWLPLLLGGAAAAGSVMFLIYYLLKLKKMPVEQSPAAEELFKGLMLIVAVPLLVYAAAYWPAGAAFAHTSLTGPIDLFREGESLSAAQAMIQGRLPFQEILLRHGFLSDISSGLVAMDLFGPSFESYRLLLAVLAPLGLMAVYLLSIFCLPWIWAIAITLTLLTGNLGSIPFTRFFLPLVSFIFTLYFIQRNKWYILIFSGLLTALSLIASFTAGIMALAGHLALLFGFLAFGSETWKQRAVAVGVFLGSCLLGLIPWWLYLGMSGSLGAYFENFGWVLSQYTAVFSLPVPDWGSTSGIWPIVQFILPPAAILLGVLAVLLAIQEIREKGFMLWNVLLLTVVTALFWWRYLSRSDAEFLQDALPAAALLLAFFAYRLTVHQRTLRGILLAAFIPVLFIPQPGKHTLTQLAGGFGDKNKIEVAGFTQSKVERLSQVFLPAQQTKELEQIVEYLGGQIGSSETFYDFSNQPLLYFLVPRRPVTQALCTAEAATFSQQLRAVRDIANTEVKMVLFPGANAPEMSLDNIPSIVRQYAISEYLLQSFVPINVVGKWVIFSAAAPELKPDPRAVDALRQTIALQELPAAWGEMSKYDPGQGSVVGRFIAPAGVRAVLPESATVTAQGDGLKAAAGSRPLRLLLQRKAEDQDKKGNVLVLQLTVSEALNHATAVLSWGGAEADRITFKLQGDGQSHRYAFRVGAVPAWVYQEAAKKLVLDLPGGGWTWESAVLLQVQDIPELARLKDKAAGAGKKP